MTRGKRKTLRRTTVIQTKPEKMRRGARIKTNKKEKKKKTKMRMRRIPINTRKRNKGEK